MMLKEVKVTQKMLLLNVDIKVMCKLISNRAYYYCALKYGGSISVSHYLTNMPHRYTSFYICGMPLTKLKAAIQDESVISASLLVVTQCQFID